MTYNKLIYNLSTTCSVKADAVFDLMPKCVKSKIIYAVGKGATNTCAFLSSIMSECSIPHSRAIGTHHLEPKDRFLRRGWPVSIKKLTVCADRFSKQAEMLSSEELCFLMALELLDTNNGFLMIEMTRELYDKVALKLPIHPYAVIFCDTNGEIRVPSGTEEVIALTNEADHDYISPKTTENGAHLSLVSPNKIEISSSSLLKTSFYYNSEPYVTGAVDKKNIRLASLAIESARTILSAPGLHIARGIKKALPELDAVLLSVSPTVILKLGSPDIELPRTRTYSIITENDGPIPESISEDAVFCGSADFLESVKKNIAHSKKNRHLSR